ncbi:MAG: IclR family transcriptional regulator [Bryobacterales bacterium]|nr:IclR family transcriptional regulator [Bryobacterales bacterium]
MKPATTISKVCRVLGEFRQRPSLGVTDLARRTGLLPSDVHRILSSLRHCGFVEQNPQTKTYRLGVGMMKLGLAAFQRNELREAARPLLLRLSEEVEATAHLAIFDPQEFDIFLADQFDTSAEIPFKANFGATAAAHCTALGKAIMANIDHGMALRYLEQKGTPRSAPNTMTQLVLIEEELRKTQLQGYSLDQEESAGGACCVGAAVRDWTGETVAAISVSMPSQKFYRQQQAMLASAVRATAFELSQLVGYQPLPIAART